MADTKTSDETAATALDGTELVRIVQSSSSKKTTAAVLGFQLRGAKVRITSDDTAVNATSGHTLLWDEAVYDTDGFWSAGAPTRLTIPALKGITHVDISAKIFVTSSTIGEWAGVECARFNSSDVKQELVASSRMEMDATGFYLNVAEVGIAVDDGDYFTFILTVAADTSVTINSTTTPTAMTIVVGGMEPL